MLAGDVLSLLAAAMRGATTLFIRATLSIAPRRRKSLF